MTPSLSSRRRFLRRMGWGTWVAGFLFQGRDPLLAEVLDDLRAQSAGADPGNEAFWASVREKFLLEPGLTYLNAGTTGAMPRAVFDAQMRYQRLLAENPKIRHTFEYERVPNDVRQKAADWIGATLDETALTHNTTEGLNIVAHGLPLVAGDHVVTTDQEHPGHREPWRLRAKRDRIEVTEARIPIPLPSAAEFVRAVEGALAPRTRVIAIPHIPTTVGMVDPVREVCALARSRGIWSLVDGAHAVGQIKVDVKAIGCDFYATSPHKWLHAPLGNGIFYVRREVQDTLWPLTGAAGWDRFADARRFSAFGNRSWATAMALGDAIDFASAIGIDRIEARLRSLTTRFSRDLLNVPGIGSLSPSDPTLYCGMSAYRISKHPARALVAALRDQHRIVVGEKADGFRADIGYYITPDQLAKAVETIDRLMRKDQLTAS
jgi:selenocysteine lyase/cysteine desulfurase